MKPSRFGTIHDLARLTGYSARTLYRYRDRGIIFVAKRYSFKNLQYDLDACVANLERHAKGSAAKT
jgi:phage terminase Nu1 subunit (DNA packaging protein)